MATEEEDQRMSLDQIEDADSSDSSSEDGDPREVAETEEQPVEWLATSRAKRSTAGNRMKSMLAIEEPDDDLELLFAEDGEDGGFTDVDEDASDVQMDSSSDDDDGHENADEDEGEKELARQARESKQAARKRKAQEAIPMKFRKKVKISTDTTSSVTTTPAPRPKRKSERASWLPSTSDMPTRASKRETTMLSKEQLHQQMLEREAKRLKQVDAMERKAKRMEALKKPPMTQAERLAEAALVEKRNAKSLNRWEEAEKQREAERRAKLAALNNRQLSGPVVTFWSGMGEWIDGKLKHVGKIVTIEEKPVKKKRTSTAGVDAAEPLSKDEEAKETGQKAEPEAPVQKGEATQATVPETTSEPAEAKEKTVPAHKEAESNSITHLVSQPTDEQVVPSKNIPQEDSQEPLPQQKLVSPEPKVSGHETDLKDQPRPSLENPIQEKPMQPKPAELKAPDIKPPDMNPRIRVYTPPACSRHLLSCYSSPSPMGPKSSNVLAPPMSAPRQSPLAAPQPDTRPSPAPLAPPAPSVPSAPSAPSATPTPTPPQPQAAQTPSAPKPPTLHPRPTKTPSSSKPVPSHTGRSKGHAQKEKALPPPRPPTPPPNGKATRNCILLQNFNENAIAQKTVQTRILFGKDMPKLAKPGPAPRCVITNHLARYRDPETGLPYYNSYAYKQIQKLKHGDYKWSQLVGAWVGSGSLAATGVPARFLDPDAPAPPKVEAQQPAVPEEKKPEETSQGKPGEVALSTPAAPTTPATPTGAAQTTPSGVIPGSTSSVSLSKATETTQSKPTGPAMTPATRPPAETQAGTSNHPPQFASVTEKTVAATHHSTSKDVNSEASGSLSLNAPVVPVESGPVRSTTSPVGPATPSQIKTSPTSTSAPALIPAPETAQEGEAPSSASAVQTHAAVQQ
ncbi:hypothetical protein PG996_000565 [Apiospora saccharicola]|uniref:Vps72/YL1 C-terminal domain-containing protein n=1 Tax=Apiospora saccharicola TaxID=335842 RepID=A0ABR1WHZ3_9PEZI